MFFTIRKKIILMMVLLIFGGICSLGFLGDLIMWRHTTIQVGKRLQEVAENIKINIINYLNERTKEVEKLSKSKTISLFLHDPESVSVGQVQDELSLISQNWHEIAVLDKKGMEAVKVAEDSPSVMFRDRSGTEYFKDVQRLEDRIYTTPFLKSWHGEIEKVYAKRIQSPDEEFIGFVVLELSISQISHIISDIKVNTVGKGYVVDKEGIFISHPNKDKVFKERLGENGPESVRCLAMEMIAFKSGTSRCRLEGVDSLVAYLPIEELDWSIAIALPYSEINWGAMTLRKVLFLISCIVIVAGILAGLWLTRRIVNPLDRLTKVSDSIANGDLDQEIKIGARDEIGRLEDSFSRMIYELKESQRRLIQAKDMMLRITEGIDEAIMLLDKDFRILWVNRKAEELAGLGRDKILGEICYKITHGRDEPCRYPFDLCPIDEVLKTGKSHTVLHTHIDKAGREISVEVSAYPIRNEEGEIVQFVHITRDISEKMRLYENLKKYSGGLEAANKELESRLMELERFSRVAVDRELRMAELKGRIEELEGIIAKMAKGST